VKITYRMLYLMRMFLL